MNSWNNILSVYFIGIGGIGMSALARFFNEKGVKVYGYDKTASSLTNTLMEEGISIGFEDEIAKLRKDADLVVYTPAIPKDSKIFNWYRDNNYQVLKRSQVLGLISENYKCIAIAGSHGKTTVSSMIAHLLNQDMGCTAFLGGIASNYGTNYIHTSEELMVVEADEYDRSFLTLHPNVAGITAIDTDHLEVYGSLGKIEEEFIQFANQIEEGGVLFIHENYMHVAPKINAKIEIYSYGQSPSSSASLSNYKVESGQFYFDVIVKGELINDIRASFGGIHNLENASLAIAIAKELGLENETIRAGMASFQGIRRRFEKHVDKNGVVYMDDYAHHPKEIKALMDSLEYLYPAKKVVVIFQPHLYSRTNDLCSEFAEELSRSNELALLPIYPAREEPIPGVTSSLILDKVSHDNKRIIEKNDLLAFVKEQASDAVIVTVGAGDIDRFVEAIKTMLG